MKIRHTLLAAACAMATQVAVAAERPLDTVTAEKTVLAQELVVDAIIEAVNQSTVAAQTSGRVSELLIDVNDFVQEGQVIVRLRDTEQRAALTQAEAALNEAQSRANEATAEFRRVRDIYARKLVSKANLDAATAARDAADARLSSAQAGVERAREQLDYTKIKAPYSGIVLERFVSLGESVQPGQALMAGFLLDELRAVANVPQRTIELVRENQQARVIRGQNLPDVVADRLVIFPYADPATRAFKVRALLPMKTASVYPGMFVKVAFRTGIEERLLIPAQSVIRRSEMVGAYVVNGDSVTLRQLRVGNETEDGNIEVLAGLDAGESIALDPVAAMQLLRDKTAIAETAQ